MGRVGMWESCSRTRYNGNSRSTPARVALNSVVRVFCTHKEPGKTQYNSLSNGFVIRERLVLTDAVSLSHYTVVKLKRRCSNAIYAAQVLSIDVERNLALLTVDYDKFWEDASPVEIGVLPTVQDAITVVSLVEDSISLSSVVVSYVQSELLWLGICPAINSRDSGGPAFNDAWKCVGISGGGSHVIPIPIIMTFIQDYEKTESYTATGNDSDEHDDSDNAENDDACEGVQEDEYDDYNEENDDACGGSLEDDDYNNEDDDDACGGSLEDEHNDSDDEEISDNAIQPPASMVVDASESPPAVVVGTSEPPTAAAEFFWRGHRVSQKCLDLLNAVENWYPGTFMGLKIRREKLWETYLEIFEQVMSKFLGIAVVDLTPGLVADLRSDLEELTEYGFDISWASEHLNDVGKRWERERAAEREIRELEVSLTTTIHRMEALKKEVCLVEAEMAKTTQLLETKRELIAGITGPSFSRLSSACLGIDLV